MSRRAPAASLPVVLCLAVAVAVSCAGEAEEREGVDLARGEQVFAANCAACHGEAGVGTTSGPPLVHEIYEPGHHPDESFVRAIREGVPAHHWDYGPMPAISGLNDEEIEDVIAYVRELQREAGIIE